MTTIRDVADRAGVSIATVSHIINQTRPVSDELRQVVLAAMDELNYRPNRLARSLRRGQTQTFGMVIPDTSNSFFSEVARGVEAASFERGYSVILCNSEGDPDREQMYVDLLIEKQVDGILFIAAGMHTEHLISTLQSARVPVAVTDRDAEHVTADFLGIDNAGGGHLATSHLISLGHRRIGCISGPSDFTPSARRVVGYRQTLADHGIAVDEQLVVKGDWTYEGGYSGASQLLTLADPPTAIFACNDVMAISVISAAAEMGLKVPRDLSIIGFDDIRLASFTNPTLSTIAQPKYELGAAAVTMLLERMQNPQLPSRRKLFGIDLIVRKSTGPPPPGRGD